MTVSQAGLKLLPLPPRQAADALRYEIEASHSAKTSNADGGTALVALDYVAAHLKSVIAGERSPVRDRVFREISVSAAGFRDLGPADDHLPDDAHAREIVERSGYGSLAEMSLAVFRECEASGMPKDETASAVRSVVAFVDIREEAASGRLHEALERMRKALATQ
ncbi:MAG: hypothetical protein V7704_06215 [Aurantimonas endophytica]|uniref:hypothetical protein n=1 Tax=Aurantimonas endophytica TaxID=1522175 RepID=UPI0030026C86